MKAPEFADLDLHFRVEGPDHGPPLVFAHSLGTDLRVWDKIVGQFSDRYRIIRYDLRGHGGSLVQSDTYTMGQMVREAESLIEHLTKTPCIFVGLSVGAQIGIALASKNPRLVRGLVVANSAVKVGTPQIWADRAETVLAKGTASIAEATVQRWFGTKAVGTPEADFWRKILIETSDEGYASVAGTLGRTDLISVASTLTQPVSVIAGSNDVATPPDLVRETANLIPKAEFNLIKGAGHLSPVDGADQFCHILASFLSRQDTAPKNGTHTH